jgi:hypothetical protein
MVKEAASAGFYQLGNRKYPKLQIITIEKALQGAKPAISLVDSDAAFKRRVLKIPMSREHCSDVEAPSARSNAARSVQSLSPLHLAFKPQAACNPKMSFLM